MVFHAWFPESDVSKSQPIVLIVDDEPAIREMIRFALEQAGMSVLSASDAHEALLSISERRPDIVLLASRADAECLSCMPVPLIEKPSKVPKSLQGNTLIYPEADVFAK